jgi:hypothetical protein
MIDFSGSSHGHSNAMADFTCFAENHQEGLYLCPILGEDYTPTAQIQGRLYMLRGEPPGRPVNASKFIGLCYLNDAFTGQKAGAEQ